MNFLFFILGMCFAILLFNVTISIKVHHIHEDIRPEPTEEDLDKALKAMNEPDNELDKLYETMGEVKDVMEGSDRIDV